MIRRGKRAFVSLIRTISRRDDRSCALDAPPRHPEVTHVSLTMMLDYLTVKGFVKMK